jgi:hypothetical protein
VVDGAATHAAAIDVMPGECAEAFTPGRNRCGFGSARGSRDEQTPSGAQGRDSGARVQAEVANLVEPFWQDVLEEPPKELDRMERGSVTALRVKRHGVIGDGDEAAVRDRDAVGVAAE